MFQRVILRTRYFQIAEDLGYEARKEPEPPPFRILGWFRGRNFRPDIVLKRHNRSAIVVVRSHPIMMYDVFLTYQIREREGTEALICVSDSVFDRIRGSAIEYADELGVHLCRLSEVEHALEKLLY